MNTPSLSNRRIAAPGSRGGAWELGNCALWLLLLGLSTMLGCFSSPQKQQSKDFFTSGSREADQRASQRMAQSEQLTGSGEGAAERGVRKVTPAKAGATNAVPGATNSVLKAEGKEALFSRLGGEVGISNIVADFSPRVLNDPRVNWAREGVTRGGLSIHRGQSVSWQPTPEHLDQLQKHLVQFIALATGGPSLYEGRDIKSTHAALHIANAEFDAALGDLKASLDRLQIPNREQKELLAIFESTRSEIVVER
jgi:hemoglobin